VEIAAREKGKDTEGVPDQSPGLREERALPWVTVNARAFEGLKSNSCF